MQKQVTNIAWALVTMEMIMVMKINVDDIHVDLHASYWSHYSDFIYSLRLFLLSCQAQTCLCPLSLVLSTN